MFDIAPSEFLLVAIVAILVIGPKDLPLALRTAGRWMGKMRRVSNHFRSGIETMIREAELEEMERKWREQNAAIMAQSPAEGQTPAAAIDQHDPLPPIHPELVSHAPTPPLGAAEHDAAPPLPAGPMPVAHPALPAAEPHS